MKKKCHKELLIFCVHGFFQNLSILFQNKHKEAKKKDLCRIQKALQMTMTTMKTKQKKEEEEEEEEVEL